MSLLRSLAERLGLPGRRLATFMSAGVLAVGLAACGDDESPGPEAGGGGAPQELQGDAEGGAPGEATLSELLENPSQFYGQQVTVSGATDQVFVDPGVFTIGGSVSGGGEEDGVGAGGEGGASNLLVLARQGVNLNRGEITESDTVQVTGTVCQVVAQINQEGENLQDEFLFGDAENADTAFVQQFQNQPAIFATQVDARVPQENQDETQGGGDEGVVGGGDEQQQQQGTPGGAPGANLGTVQVQGQGQCPQGTGGDAAGGQTGGGTGGQTGGAESGTTGGQDDTQGGEGIVE